jgi:hypothetical protein
LNFFNVCLKHFLLEDEPTEYYDKCKCAFYKIREICDRFRRNLILLYRCLRNFQILNFMTVRASRVVAIRKTDVTDKDSKFVILRNRLILRLDFLVSFGGPCVKLLMITYN